MTLCLSATVEENDLVSGHRFSLHLSSIPPPPFLWMHMNNTHRTGVLTVWGLPYERNDPSSDTCSSSNNKEDQQRNSSWASAEQKTCKYSRVSSYHINNSAGKNKKGTLANTWFMPLHWWISWKLRFCKFVTLRKLIFSQNKTWSMVIRIPGFLFSLTYFMTIKTTAMKATISTRALMKKLR